MWIETIIREDTGCAAYMVGCQQTGGSRTSRLIEQKIYRLPCGTDGAIQNHPRPFDFYISSQSR